MRSCLSWVFWREYHNAAKLDAIGLWPPRPPPKRNVRCSRQQYMEPPAARSPCPRPSTHPLSSRQMRVLCSGHALSVDVMPLQQRPCERRRSPMPISGPVGPLPSRRRIRRCARSRRRFVDLRCGRARRPAHFRLREPPLSPRPTRCIQTAAPGRRCAGDAHRRSVETQPRLRCPRGCRVPLRSARELRCPYPPRAAGRR